MAKRSRRSEPVYSRTPVEAERGVCAGGHPAVADAGIRIMQEGGNAFDALAGAAFTAFVVEPAMCGLGGYARISAYAPDRGGFLSFDGYARAPLAATPHMFEPDGSRAPACYGHPCTVGDRAERGFLAAAVPGAVAGCCDAHAMLGRLPLAQVMAPAIEAAQQGIEIAWFDLLALAEVGRHLDAFPDTQAVWMPGGALPSVPYQSEQRYRVDGTALAGTLRRIAARGKRGFYAGRTAKAIDAYVRSHGGILESADLDAYRTRILREWPQRYRNLDYITCFDQVGYEALNLLGHFDLRRYGSDSHAYRHLVAEALAVAFADSMTHYGDPDFENAPVNGLAHAGFAAHRRRAMRVRKALPRPVEAGNPWPYERFVDAPERIETRPGTARVSGTSQAAAADREGNMASICMSIGGAFGSLVYVPELGIVLNNAMQNFDLRPDHPNAIKPGKMPIVAAPVLVAARQGEGTLRGRRRGRLPDRDRGASRVHERRRSPHAHPARDRSPARALPGTRDLRGCADTRGSSAPPLPRGTRGRDGGGESGQPALRPRGCRHPGAAPRRAPRRCGTGVAYLRGGLLMSLLEGAGPRSATTDIQGCFTLRLKRGSPPGPDALRGRDLHR